MENYRRNDIINERTRSREKKPKNIKRQSLKSKSKYDRNQNTL